MNIKELSRELGVSEQALRSWCKRNGVRKESETKGKKAGYLLTENDEKSIREYYSTKGKQEKEIKKGNESKTLRRKRQANSEPFGAIESQRRTTLTA